MKNLKVDFKVEIPNYDGTVDVEKLDDWIDRLETYFSLGEYSSREKIKASTLKLSKHALTWWKSYKRKVNYSEVTWKTFKELLKKQFYPVGFLEQRWSSWYNLRQRYVQSVQEYTTDSWN